MGVADDIHRHLFWPSPTFHLRDALPYFGPRFLTGWLEAKRSPEPPLLPGPHTNEFRESVWLIVAAMKWAERLFPKHPVPDAPRFPFLTTRPHSSTDTGNSPETGGKGG